jgi:hypothetical protein
MNEHRARRPVLGRKGIGKFAGFGIASVITISTGAAMVKTSFRLAIDEAPI